MSWRNNSTSLRNLSFSQPEAVFVKIFCLFSHLPWFFKIFSVKLSVSLKKKKSLQTSFTFVYLASSNKCPLIWGRGLWHNFCPRAGLMLELPKEVGMSVFLHFLFLFIHRAEKFCEPRCLLFECARAACNNRSGAGWGCGEIRNENLFSPKNSYSGKNPKQTKAKYSGAHEFAWTSGECLW